MQQKQVGWLRRIGGGVTTRWHAVVTAGTGGACWALLHEHRCGLPFALCELAVLPAGQRPEAALRLQPPSGRPRPKSPGQWSHGRRKAMRRQAVAGREDERDAN